MKKKGSKKCLTNNSPSDCKDKLNNKEGNSKDEEKGQMHKTLATNEVTMQQSNVVEQFNLRGVNTCKVSIENLLH